MIRVVLDTNVLVSALWTPAGNASTIVALILTDKIFPCFDYAIMEEYRAVLSRPRLAFSSGDVETLLAEIASRGLSVTVSPSTIKLPDEADRKFYDVATFCEAYLITGNAKHYPKVPNVVNPAQFLALASRKGGEQ